MGWQLGMRGRSENGATLGPPCPKYGCLGGCGTDHNSLAVSLGAQGLDSVWPVWEAPVWVHSRALADLLVWLVLL